MGYPFSVDPLNDALFGVELKLFGDCFDCNFLGATKPVSKHKLLISNMA